MYQNPELAKKTFPSKAAITKAQQKADEQDASKRDVRPLMSILRRAATANPRLAGHILTRKTALLSFDWEIASSDERFEQIATEAKIRTASALRRLVSYHTDVPLYGVTALEIGFTRPASPVKGFFVDVTRRYDPTEIERTAEREIGFLDAAGKATRIVTKDDPTVFDILVDHDDLLDRGGTLRSVVFHATLAHETLEEWSKLNARMKGIIAGVVDAEKFAQAVERLNLSQEESQKALDNLEETLKNAGEDNYLKTISAVDIQLKSIVEAAAGGSYGAFLQKLDADIAISILGQANTSELPSSGGSRAALQVLDLIRTDILFSDMERTTAFANELLLLDYRYNVDRNATAIPYRFRFVSEQAVDAESAARTYETLSRIGGISVAKTEFYEKLGLRVPSEDEETIDFPAASPSGF